MNCSVQINPQSPAQVHGSIACASVTLIKQCFHCPLLCCTFSRAVYPSKCNKQVKVLVRLAHYFSGIFTVCNNFRLWADSLHYHRRTGRVVYTSADVWGRCFTFMHDVTSLWNAVMWPHILNCGGLIRLSDADRRSPRVSWITVNATRPHLIIDRGGLS